MGEVLSIACNLAAAGIEKPHAEAIASVFREAERETPSRSDIAEIKAGVEALKTSIHGLTASTGPHFAAIQESTDAHFRAMRWLVGANMGLTLVLLAAILAR